MTSTPSSCRSDEPTTASFTSDSASSRASAKQKVADSWADRRRNSVKNHHDDASKQQAAENDALPVCASIRRAWEQLTLDISRRWSGSHSASNVVKSKSPSKTSRVFPSVESALQASAVSQVVETFHDNVVMDVLPPDYDWQKAIVASTESRERAFLLLDLSAVVKSHFACTRTFQHVDIQYKVQHNRDVKLLELFARLNVGLRLNSSHDVEAASSACNERALLVDDAGATRKPDGYLRRFLKASSACIAVDGPEEVKRIHNAHQRLIQRDEAYRSRSLSFSLKLSRTYDEWNSLLKSTRQTCDDIDSQLVGLSVELMSDPDDLQRVHDFLDENDLDGLHVDVTGTVTYDMAPFLTEIAKSHSVSADLSDLLVAHAGALCTRIIGVKTVDDVRNLYIDDGCYGSLCRDWSNEHHEYTPLPLLCRSDADTHNTTVWGPTCDGLDKVCSNVQLPEMHVDEWLVFPDMGLASGNGTAFNGFDPPDTAYCILGYFHKLEL